MNTPTIAYVHPPGHEVQAERFIATFTEFGPERPYRMTVILNGIPFSPAVEALFRPLTHQFFFHDDTGWDIGAYRAFAAVNDGPILFCGGYTHFRRAGWLRRLGQAWDRFGPGMYGTSASYEVRPHLNTTGFLTCAELLRAYPYPSVTKDERYAFEHGPNAYHVFLAREKWPVKLVTWDGIWDMADWRKPPNIFRRGDQSNMLIHFNHSDMYEQSPPARKQQLAELADRGLV
jgi:hypothetical protein